MKFFSKCMIFLGLTALTISIELQTTASQKPTSKVSAMEELLPAQITQSMIDDQTKTVASLNNQLQNLIKSNKQLSDLVQQKKDINKSLADLKTAPGKSNQKQLSLRGQLQSITRKLYANNEYETLKRAYDGAVILLKRYKTQFESSKVADRS